MTALPLKEDEADYMDLDLHWSGSRFLATQHRRPRNQRKKKRWSYFIRKVHETDPLTCPKCQGGMRIISFIDQPEVIKKILQHLGLWEESHAPPARDPAVKEITFRGEPQGRTFDPSYSQLI